jgi:hypothetical protein
MTGRSLEVSSGGGGGDSEVELKIDEIVESQLEDASAGRSSSGGAGS